MNSIPNLIVFQLDVTNKKSIKNCFDAVIKEYGRIDVVVNNAGLGIYKPFELATDDEIRHLFDTNLFGMMNICREVLPMMRKQRKGTIINVSSAVGVLALPFYTAYCSTKFAVEGFSEALYYEALLFGIKVKIIEPGAIKTDFFKNTKNLSQQLGDNNTAQEIYAEYKKYFPQSLDRKKSFEITPSENVAAIIYKAANDKNKKLRYTAGIDSKAGIFLRKVLPQWLFFRLLRMVKKERKINSSR
ncbi:TPA: SDR family oxidoreductase [Candidatus Woesearchaeota archaeon]|nr:SDR family oxidoreductase [Candidatus Woesearchaeota archaeon]